LHLADEAFCGLMDKCENDVWDHGGLFVWNMLNLHRSTCMYVYKTHLNRSKVTMVAMIPIRERTTPTIVRTSSVVSSGPDG